MSAYDAAALAQALREELISAGETFVFETVFSDPVGEKVAFLSTADARGYQVAVCFIGLGRASTSDDRVAMRVLQGGHDVPAEKVQNPYARSLENLARANRELPLVWVYDNSDLARPFRKLAEFEHGELVKQFALRGLRGSERSATCAALPPRPDRCVPASPADSRRGPRSNSEDEGLVDGGFAVVAAVRIHQRLIPVRTC